MLNCMIYIIILVINMFFLSSLLSSSERILNYENNNLHILKINSKKNIIKNRYKFNILQKIFI
ncbi:hypothetical protein XW81_02665 [Buchnera aphidicola (Schlechtendalia chinensis)]|uniref:Uncharacterized protein n=1 Tax=Buchnera aphidicola subsp. Schlechtendalia chinensis TaxID=118110 RepID=A0A172WE90_BUCSC|nr:hypothetical protein XW81_02665 [Buchnera aphidicola (Schlechtendalia chinensis)]